MLYKVALGTSFIDFEANKEYLIGEDFYKKLQLAVQLDWVQQEKFAPTNRYSGENLTDKSLLIFKSGGLGDILFTTPSIKFIKELYPNCKIGFACFAKHTPILEDNPYVDAVHTVPLEAPIISNYDYLADFEGILEYLSTEENAYDVFAKYFDATLVNPIPYVPVDNKKVKYFRHKYAIGRKVVSVVPSTSSPIRTIDPGILNNICQKLATKYTVLLLDNDSQWSKTIAVGKHVKSCVDYCKNDLKNYIALIGSSDCVVSADTSAVHIAAGLNIPLVGIYGPFPSVSRLKYYRNAIGIDCKTNCAPCYTHSSLPCRVARTIGVYYSPCFLLANPELVYSQVSSLLTRKG